MIFWLALDSRDARISLRISNVESILPATSIQQASSSGSTLYSLRLRSKSGQTYTLVKSVILRADGKARWIVWEIEKRAGLQSNTQVAIVDSFYGPPPRADLEPQQKFLKNGPAFKIAPRAAPRLRVSCFKGASNRDECRGQFAAVTFEILPSERSL